MLVGRQDRVHRLQNDLCVRARLLQLADQIGILRLEVVLVHEGNAVDPEGDYDDVGLVQGGGLCNGPLDAVKGIEDLEAAQIGQRHRALRSGPDLFGFLPAVQQAVRPHPIGRRVADEGDAVEICVGRVLADRQQGGGFVVDRSQLRVRRVDRLGAAVDLGLRGRRFGGRRLRLRKLGLGLGDDRSLGLRRQGFRRGGRHRCGGRLLRDLRLSAGGAERQTQKQQNCQEAFHRHPPKKIFSPFYHSAPKKSNPFDKIRTDLFFRFLRTLLTDVRFRGI